MSDVSAAPGPSLTIFPPRRDAYRTICILESEGGGAALVTNIVRKVGIFMGERVDDATGEDRSFHIHGGQAELFLDRTRSAERALFLTRASELISDRNNTHDVWGWKDSLASYYLPDIMPKLRNPVFIFVTRDVGAIAQDMRFEQKTVARAALLSHVRTAAHAYAQIAEILGQRARPTLLISYERTLEDPFMTAYAIAEFLNSDTPPDLDCWLRDYLRNYRTYRLNVTSAAPPRRQFSSTPAVRTLLEESARSRHEGFVAEAVPKQGILAASNTLYESGIALLNEGDAGGAQDRALAIINIHVPLFPHLFDGALGVIAETAFGAGPELVHPDVLCGAYYMLGLARLLKTAGQAALVCLTVAEALMRRRLELQLPEAILSRANYWSCVFHIGMAAKAIGRADLVAKTRGKVLSASMQPPAPDLIVLGTEGLAEIRRRAEAEL